AGKVKDRRSYGVWGDERDPNNWLAFKAAPKDELKLPNSGYTGTHERRQRGATAPGISGLIDMQARYYDPAAMQFLQPDGVVPDPANPLSWNRRTYVDNSPVAFSDPTGHAPEKNESGLTEGGEEFVERKAQELDDATTGGGTYLANGGGLGSAFTGILVGNALAVMRARYELRNKPLSQKTVSEMTSEEKFYVQAYMRDKGNYERAGMAAPFDNVEEYLLWREMSREAQAMGISSQYLGNMADRTEVAADAVGFGNANPANKGAGGLRAASKAGGGRRPVGGWAWGRRLYQPSEAIAKAAENNTLHIKTIQPTKRSEAILYEVSPARHLIADGKKIAEVNANQTNAFVILERQYASVANTRALWKKLTDTFPNTQGYDLHFDFGSDAAGAAKFGEQLRKQGDSLTTTSHAFKITVEDVEPGITYVSIYNVAAPPH
ncbi:hypothetical protein M2650_16375, partial [Luteimonas sp. SX5]